MLTHFSLLRRISCIAALLGLAAQAQGQEVVKVQDYPGLGNLMLRVAIAQKFCDKHGIKCEPRVIPAAPLGLQTLMAGDIEFAFGPVEVLAQAALKGAELQITGSGAKAAIFFIAAGNHLETPNAAKGYPAVMQDLKGKKVGVTARGTGSEFQLVELLKGAGMSASDVTMVAVGAPNTALPALMNKQVDAVMAFEPMAGFCEVLKACKVIVSLNDGQGPKDMVVAATAGSVMITRKDYIAKKPQAVAAFNAAMRDAETFMQNPANYDAVLKVSMDTFKIDVPKGAEVVSDVLKRSLFAYKYSVDPKIIQANIDYLVATKQLEKPVDAGRLIYKP